MENDEGEKVVARFKDGRLVKGYVMGFSVESEQVVLIDQKTRQEQSVPIDDLKAVYFVKTFTGSSEYVERKTFGIRRNPGRKVFIKFSDNETLVGFVEGDVPWDKGFSLEKLGKRAKGFFLTPVDGDVNNEKVFVVGSAILDITIVAV